jgi:3-oxoacyl-[acyl-carrier-protein] synthase-3
MVEIANRIESGRARAGLVVACEASREINEIVIQQLREKPTMDFFKLSLATLTGGSGAAAVLLTDGSFGGTGGRKLIGGVWRTAPQFHDLCRWGIESAGTNGSGTSHQFTATDAAAVQSHGVELGTRTWRAFLDDLGWSADAIDKVICHQVGASHRDTILKRLGLPEEKDFPTFPYLGNMGTVSLPLTAGLAEDRGFLESGDRVAFLGIGSGLNCMMLGLEW